MPFDLQSLAENVSEILKKHKLMLTTAESCTGGQVAEVITTITGSSNWFERGFVTYSNESKQEMLGIPAEIIAKHGAVSEATAHAMAEGALKHSHADVSLAVTGIAGPDGGTQEKPVGTVWFAWARKGAETKTLHQHFQGDRITIRDQAVETALRGLIEFVGNTLISRKDEST